MAYKTIQLYCGDDKVEKLLKLAESEHVLEAHVIKQKNKLHYVTYLVRSDHVQSVTDKVQSVMGSNPEYHTTVMTVDTVIPRPEQQEPEGDDKKQFLGVSREELLDIVSKGVSADKYFFLLVVFSTIVAAIGLLEDNVAVVIGAMVIAPLLGPNLALAFAASLGDVSMMRQAVKTNLYGFSTCLVMSVAIGMLWPFDLTSKELLMRTDVSFDGVILAIVSGAAAVLSLTRGISSVMVGVMVAVALLPPATTLGIMVGAQEYELAKGALLLLTVNIVCVNLAAKLTLLFKGVRPRTWYAQKTAKSRSLWYLAFWFVALALLLLVIYQKGMV